MVVGSIITRPQLITKSFAEALKKDVHLTERGFQAHLGQIRLQSRPVRETDKETDPILI